MDFNFNFNQDLAQQEEVFAEYLNTSGVYLVKVDKAELTKSKKQGSQSHYIKFETTVIDGEHKNKKFNTNIVLTNKDNKGTYLDKNTNTQKPLPGVIDLNRILLLSDKGKLFKGSNFDILNGVKLYLAIEFKEKPEEKYPDKNIKGVFHAVSKKTSFEKKNNSEAKGFQFWTDKFKDALPVETKTDTDVNIAKINQERNEMNNSTANQDDDEFPF